MNLQNKNYPGKVSDLSNGYLVSLNMLRDSTIASLPGTSVIIPLNGLDRSSVVYTTIDVTKTNPPMMIQSARPKLPLVNPPIKQPANTQMNNMYTIRSGILDL